MMTVFVRLLLPYFVNTDLLDTMMTVFVRLLLPYFVNTDLLDTMMTVFVRLLLPYFVFLLITLHLGILFYTPNNIRMADMLRCSIYQWK
jgi:hypothetical protein